MIPPSIPAHIRAESILAHESAINTIVVSVGELMDLHGVGKVQVNRLINQLLAAYRCLVLELKEMKADE